LLVSATSQLSFAKLLGYAFSNEVAQAQISVDGGQTWLTVWSEPGNDGNSSVDSAFADETIPLTAYAGQILQVRFVYAYSGGYYFPSGSGVGLYLDNIAVSNAQQLVGAATNTVATGRSFTFVPTSATNYLLRARAQINSRVLPWGPVFVAGVTASPGSPQIQLAGQPVVSGTQVQIDFTVSNFAAGMTFQLLRTADLGATWVPDTSAKLDTLVANSTFRFTTSTAGASTAFFKIKGG
jgi:hypothetical protein